MALTEGYNAAHLDALTQAFLQDDASEIGGDEVDAAQRMALRRYSIDRPRVRSYDHTGDGTAAIALSGVTGWESGFSSLREIEYPVDEAPPTLYGRDDRAWVIDADRGKVFTPGVTISAGETGRLWFTAQHTIEDFPSSGGSTTVPNADFEAVAILAASYAAEMRAGVATGNTDSSLVADIVDRGSKGGEWASRARRLRELYAQHISPASGADAPKLPQVRHINLRTTLSTGGDPLYLPEARR